MNLIKPRPPRPFYPGYALPTEPPRNVNPGRSVAVSKPRGTLRSAGLQQLLCMVLLTILPARSGMAFDLVELWYRGPAFELELAPPSDPVSASLEDEIMAHRKSNAGLAAYDTTARFARAERLVIEKMLKARGYYEGTVEYEVRDDTIYYLIRSGPLYVLRRVDLVVPKGIHIPDDPGLGLSPGQPFTADRVLDGLQAFTRTMTRSNCLLDIDTDYRAIIDPEQRLADLTYMIEASPQVRFGKVTVGGLRDVEEAFIERRIKLESGSCFRKDRLQGTKVDLLQTNLIAAVEEQLAPPSDGLVDVHLALTERNHRTVKAGIGYNSDEGPMINAGWEHRNLFGQGERFTIDLHLSSVLQQLQGQYTEPDFWAESQSLILDLALENEDREAYKASSVTAGGTLSRVVDKTLTLSLGSQLKISSVEDAGVTEEYTLLSFPFTANWNTTDNLLDPRNGWILTGQFSPYIDLLNDNTRFDKTTVSASFYHTFDRISGDPTVALRAAGGSLTGAQLADIPADERFYSGGGGSVRGYPYQTLSALQNGDPVGGRSFVEYAGELRLHHGGAWGSALFVDGGYAFPTELPQWEADLFWSAGIGLRYYTSIAPFRVDLAWPLSRRVGIDESLQLYISLGQAF